MENILATYEQNTFSIVGIDLFVLHVCVPVSYQDYGNAETAGNYLEITVTPLSIPTIA